MTNALAAQQLSSPVDENIDPKREGGINNLLAAIAMSICDSVARFEHTAAKISDLVMKQGGQGDRNLIMTLQNFDRLQQEFSILADLVGRAAGALDHCPIDGKGMEGFCYDAVATVSIAELKDRLTYHLRTMAEELAGRCDAEDVEF